MAAARQKSARQHTGLLLAALALAGCASRLPAPATDGPPADPPARLLALPDALPRIEPIRPGGPNKPYEVLGERYQPLPPDAALAERGLASWYGRKFHGRPTASGEIYDMYAMTAAHPTLPIPSYARIRNPANGREVVVRINDRGPFHRGRIVDLSYTAALKLDLLRGVGPVELVRITHAEIRAGQGLPAPALPVLTAAPRLWVQIGSPGRLDVAQALLRRVAEADLELMPLLGIVREGGLHRLRAGPFPSRAEAVELARRLRDEAGLGGLDAAVQGER